MLILENCPFMKTPLLNPEIHSKINDSTKSRDKSAQRRQRLLVKSTIPLAKAVVVLKGLEHDAQDKIPSDIKRKLQMSLHFCIKVFYSTILCSLRYKEKEKVTFTNL